MNLCIGEAYLGTYCTSTVDVEYQSVVLVNCYFGPMGVPLCYASST